LGVVDLRDAGWRGARRAAIGKRLAAEQAVARGDGARLQ
jgi:hypothetical protein